VDVTHTLSVCLKLVTTHMNLASVGGMSFSQRFPTSTPPHQTPEFQPLVMAEPQLSSNEPLQPLLMAQWAGVGVFRLGAHASVHLERCPAIA
jgi:hypothetical protein